MEVVNIENNLSRPPTSRGKGFIPSFIMACLFFSPCLSTRVLHRVPFLKASICYRGSSPSIKAETDQLNEAGDHLDEDLQEKKKPT